MEDAPEQKKILDSVAYHWEEADSAVVRFYNSSDCDNSRVFANRGTTSMGYLALLPVEILHNILHELDFESLGAMKRLNSQSKDIVEVLPAYRDLTTFACDALRALSATNLLSRYNAKHLYTSLSKDRCFSCGRFGSFLYLPTGCRCCFSCIEGNPELDVVSPSAAAALFGLASRTLKQIAIITTVPGDYGITRRTQRRRIRLVGRGEAWKLAILTHGSEGEMERAIQVAKKPVPKPPNANHALNFMACAPFPYLDIQRRRVDKGVCCRGCEYDWYRRDEDFPPGYELGQDLYRKQNITFSEDGFLVHFETCRSAKMLWDDYILKHKELSESVRCTLFRT